MMDLWLAFWEQEEQNSGSELRRESMLRSPIVVIAAIALCTSALAQNANGILDGRITDSSGASIPGAKVTVENQGTGTSQQYTTNADGRFYQGQVLIGAYRVTVEKTGFQKYVQSNIQVDVAQTVSLEIALKVGDVSTTVEVQASVAQLTTESSQLSTAINSKAILDLRRPAATRLDSRLWRRVSYRAVGQPHGSAVAGMRPVRSP